MDGKQGGDPAKLAEAIVKLAALKEPPTRFAAGADAVQDVRGQGQRAARTGPVSSRAVYCPRAR
jgi:hypothetical protein